MTACVNKHSKRVAAVISASLVGALSLGIAPVAAMAESVDMLEVPSDAWDGVEFTWNISADKFGNYQVETGDEFMLTSAVDAFGDPVSMSNLTVIYYKDVNGDNALDANDLVWNTTPDTTGDYTVLVLNGRYDTSKWKNGTRVGGGATAINAMDSQPFKLSVEAKSLDGAFAYEGEDVSDTSFKYTGGEKDVNFADASGKKITLGTGANTDGVTATWSNGQINDSFAPENAGTYTVTLSGDGTKYSGTATVTVKIDKIDLANDVITVGPVLAGKKAFVNSDGNSGILNQGDFANNGMTVMVDGEYLSVDVVNLVAQSVVLADGTTVAPATSYEGNSPAKVSLKVTANQDLASNFVDASAETTASTVVVSAFVQDYYYDEEGIPATGLKFETAKGESFDPDLFTAVFGGKNIPIDVTVTKDGETVTDYSEPGTYNAVITCAVPDDLSYAGTTSVKVTVISRRYSEQPKVYAAIDGKDADGAEVEYTGEAIEPAVVAKADGSTLTEGEDYTVAYTDSEGNVVEEIVEPGKYNAVVDFGDAQIVKNGATTDVENVEFSFTVTKATIRSAKADKDVYDMTGEAVTPVFTAYNTANLEGLSVEIDPAEVGVTYYEAKLDNKGTWWTDEDDEWVADESKGAIKASDLKKAGKYIARVTVPADDPHFRGTIDSEMFQIGEYATFSDVDAGSWYADAVYNANDLGYMTGIKGTDLFMPLADISRAELSKVFFNMAGQSEEEGVYFPSAFADVDGWAWYAQPVAWASEAGIVTGYDADTFGPMDKASREQVAVMLYRYAKAQGKDVSVKDADAALAAYKDGDQVSDWAKTAMAWSVENGIFGVDTDELWANQNIQRAAVASIAVRFQPEALPEA